MGTACCLVAVVASAVLPARIHAAPAANGYVRQLNQGMRGLQEGKWISAAYHFRLALEWDGKGVDARIGLGNVYLKMGKVTPALEEFNAALRLRQHCAEAKQGMEQARADEYGERAVLALAKQVKNEPGNAEAHAAYAVALIERIQTEPARSEAEVALKLNVKLGHAYYVLARIALTEDRVEEASTLIEKAIRLDDTDSDALALLGDLAMKKGDPIRAISFYRRLVRILRDESEGHRKLMEALEAAGDSHGAAREKQVLERVCGNN